MVGVYCCALGSRPCVQVSTWQRCWRHPAWRQRETPLTIDQLLAQGWEIAGYASGYDNRTSLILFRHSGVNALVQCGILYDVTALRAQSSIATSCGKAQIARRWDEFVWSCHVEIILGNRSKI
jgi:hypothetical protein